MSDPYWKIVEPVWDSISIYDGENVFLEQFEKATATINYKGQALFKNT